MNDEHDIFFGCLHGTGILVEFTMRDSAADAYISAWLVVCASPLAGRLEQYHQDRAIKAGIVFG